MTAFPKSILTKMTMTTLTTLLRQGCKNCPTVTQFTLCSWTSYLWYSDSPLVWCRRRIWKHCWKLLYPWSHTCLQCFPLSRPCVPWVASLTILIILLPIDYQLRIVVFYNIWLCRTFDVEGQNGFICCDIEWARCALDQRETTVTANGETTTDRNLQIMQMSNQHLLYAAILEIKLNRGKRAEYDALHSLEIKLQA